MISARFGNVIATFDGATWSAPFSELARALNSATRLEKLVPTDYHPDREWAAACIAVRQLGGELLDYPEADYVEGRIY